MLHEVCYDSGKVNAGKCDPDAAAAGDPEAIGAESIAVANVVVAAEEPYGGKGDKFHVKLQADVQALKAIDQKSGVKAKVTCTVGKTDRVETAYLFGTDLYYLHPGETTRMTGTVFLSEALPEMPKQCSVAFSGGPRFSNDDNEMTGFGSWCLKKDAVKEGDCDGKDKPKGAAAGGEKAGDDKGGDDEGGDDEGGDDEGGDAEGGDAEGGDDEGGDDEGGDDEGGVPTPTPNGGKKKKGKKKKGKKKKKG